MNNNRNIIIQEVRKAKKILITGHIGADLDSLGSTLAMFGICKTFSKKSEIIPLIWEELQYKNLKLPYLEELKIVDKDNTNNSLFEDTDLAIFVDTGELHRSPLHTFVKENKIKTIVIDHHIDSCKQDIDKIFLLINYPSRSTTKMIYNEFFSKNNSTLTYEIGQNILAGIYGDTEFLTDVNITPDDFKLIQTLQEKGCNLNQLVLSIQRSKSIGKLKSISKCLLNYTKIINNQYAVCIVNHNDLKNLEKEFNYKLTKQDVLDEIRNIEGIDFAIVILEQKENFLSASLKSRTDRVDLQKIASHYGGGGHKTSSAFRFDTNDFNKSVYEIISYINNYLIDTNLSDGDTT